MGKSKSALITGVTGQDGAYLAKFLLKKGYNVFGTFRRTSTPNFWRLSSLGIENNINYISADLIDTPSLMEAIKISKPDEVYHLAAQSYVGSSFNQPVTSGEFSGLAVTRVLESIRLIDPQIKFYQASSSEIFGDVKKNLIQNENTPFRPQSPYAIAKLYGYWTTKMYRDGYDMFASNGILFNHESPLRGLEFVTRKITNSVARIKLGLQKKIILGNLKSYRDWGHSYDYVRAMHLMLQQDEPGDWVVSTMETHSVREMCDLVFHYLKLDYKDYIVQNPKYMRPEELPYLKGDSTKIRTELGWKPKYTFRGMMEEMTKYWLDFYRNEKLQKQPHTAVTAGASGPFGETRVSER